MRLGSNRSTGRVYDYVRSGATWRLRQTLRVRDGADGCFGNSLAISGKVLVVSAAGAGSGANGVTYIYVRSGQRWRSQARLNDPANGTGDDCGADIAVSNSIAVIGANDVNGEAGAAYIYGQSGSTWKRQFWSPGR